ncbi:uncharacterized protein LOC125075222 [Vanessa atalanta]|uniref:uncharacterized protein LOC125075222 n=1 Tax=Vanessa atalanta TaxID=42275 RepID=UPI001FCE23AD|nr:uncharacterized protein LOC125075222 [Vanessa atalanta]XP_047542871.1 uncharacterized protein LOC125075222 [Vanessa atalanta]
MGSPKVSNLQPHSPMADDKKSIKNLLKKPFQALFQKKDKVKQKREVKNETATKPTEKTATPISVLLDKFDKLEIEKKEEIKEEENEFDNFSYKIIEDDNRSARIDSPSDDSGYAEKFSITNDSEDERDELKLIDSLKNLKVDPDKKVKEDDKRKRKLQTVLVSRGPIRNRAADFGTSVHPYGQEAADSVYRQINQINKQTFSGGQVIVNANARSENCSEIDLALKQIEINVRNFAQNSQQEQVDRWQIAQEFITESSRNVDDILSEFIDQDDQNISNQITNYASNTKSPTPNPVEEFSTANHTHDYDIDLSIIDGGELEKPSIFPTPPRSENVPSPMSDSHSSFNPINSDYTLSPETSSPMSNSDYEKYQDITPFDEYPSCITDNVELDKDVTDKKKDRTLTSSMTMKQFKDLQKEIANNYSKKECCQINRRPCKEIFTEYLQKLDIDERKNNCRKITQLDLENCYGVLHYVLLNLSNDKDVNLNMSLFMLICEKVLALKPMLFVGDFGLSLLKSAVLRCNTRPLLTRYLVQCIRTVTRTATYKPANDYVFSEVDALGDSLVTACARAGDECADVLAEIVRREDGDQPLFNVHQANTDGYTALHVCCGEHSARTPRAHALHVLLKHAGADLWRGDIKGGDTPLHLAVNSANCDLTIIMILFQHIDRKEWRKLAHVQNRSSVNPLEYARSAMKSTSRQNYPVEVLDFLKKCR